MNKAARYSGFDSVVLTFEGIRCVFDHSIQKSSLDCLWIVFKDLLINEARLTKL